MHRAMLPSRATGFLGAAILLRLAAGRRCAWSAKCVRAETSTRQNQSRKQRQHRALHFMPPKPGNPLRIQSDATKQTLFWEAEIMAGLDFFGTRAVPVGVAGGGRRGRLTIGNHRLQVLLMSLERKTDASAINIHRQPVWLVSNRVRFAIDAALVRSAKRGSVIELRGRSGKPKRELIELFETIDPLR